MSNTDLLLLIPIVIGAFNGYKRGLLVEIIGIIAFVLAIVFGFRFLGLGMSFLSAFIGEDFTGRMLPYLSFLLIFFPTIFFINKLGWLFRKALRLTFLGILDGIGGAALGAVLWAFGISVLFWIVAAIGLNIPERFLAESEVYPIVENLAPNIISKISDHLPSLGEVFTKLTELAAKYRE